jgi:hypothetical protein
MPTIIYKKHPFTLLLIKPTGAIYQNSMPYLKNIQPAIWLCFIQLKNEIFI